jgi:hypothetical protein
MVFGGGMFGARNCPCEWTKLVQQIERMHADQNSFAGLAWRISRFRVANKKQFQLFCT